MDEIPTRALSVFQSLEGSVRSALSEAIVMGENENLMQRAAQLCSSGMAARQAGEEAAAEGSFREAFKLAAQAAHQAEDNESLSGRLEVVRTAARLALECGEVAEARRLIDQAESHIPAAHADEWAELCDVNAWQDAWLVAAVRRDPPDEAALDALAVRYWKPLFGRCQLMTLNHQKAGDLAQEVWCRVLRTRHALKPGGNFPAYLTTIATNLWRDWYRSARRAGAMADYRLESLDAEHANDTGESVVLVDILPDLNALQADEQTLLAMDIDKALEHLTPQLREVLVARFITGESCAEIGRRYGRTEQSISGWVRQALREMKLHLEESSCAALESQT